ncbi:MAG: type II secretion system F family protein [Kiritimatiellae bacterium]|nr:type II secretion system F family protein [Kiritimatiellia bacterium]
MEYLQNIYVVYALVFAAVALPVALVLRASSGVASGEGAAWSLLPSLYKKLWGPMTTFEPLFGPLLAKMMRERAERYESLILASNLPLTASRVFTLQALTLFGGLVIGAIFFVVPDLDKGWAIAATLVFAFIGWTYPAMLLEKYVDWRQTEITRQLPFAIDLIGSAMRAGLEFGAAMRYFESLKMPGPLTEEFGKVLQQIELGKTRVEALGEMARRVQVESFTSFVGVVAYGTEIGASRSETLAVHGEELRRARFHLAERKAARAPSLMILPMAVFILPAVFIIVITPVMMKMKGTGMGQH